MTHQEPAPSVEDLLRSGRHVQQRAATMQRNLTGALGCPQHHAVCQGRRINADEQALSCDCRCHTKYIVICVHCGAEVEWGQESNEHTRIAHNRTT